MVKSNQVAYTMLQQKIMRTPRNVDIDITSKCNLCCKYCYYFDRKDSNYVDLPTEEWLQFFEELEKCAVLSVCLAGGEPFMREDLPDLLKGIVGRRMRFSILSNGTLIDDKIARFIASTGRCDYVQISLDGSHPQIHDMCRGKDSFLSAIRGIRTLQQHSVPVTVRVTIHRGNYDDIDNIAYLLFENLKLNSFSINSAGALGSCHRNASDILLTTHERQIAIQKLLRLSEMYPRRIIAQAGPLAEGKTWHLMEKARINKEKPFPTGGRLTACGCVYNKIGVRSDGVFTPCNMLPHIELGRMNRDSLSSIWLNSFPLNKLRERSSISLTGFEFCRDCPYIPYCTGNCPGLAYSITGQVDHPSPDSCLRRFLEDGGRIP